MRPNTCMFCGSYNQWSEPTIADPTNRLCGSCDREWGDAEQAAFILLEAQERAKFEAVFQHFLATNKDAFKLVKEASCHNQDADNDSYNNYTVNIYWRGWLTRARQTEKVRNPR